MRMTFSPSKNRFQDLPGDLEYFQNIFDNLDPFCQVQSAQIFLLTLVVVRRLLYLLAFGFLDKVIGEPEFKAEDLCCL